MSFKTMAWILWLGSFIAAWFMFSMVFFVAYITPDKILPISINDFGEANFELFVVTYSLLGAPFFLPRFFQ